MAWPHLPSSFMPPSLLCPASATLAFLRFLMDTIPPEDNCVCCSLFQECPCPLPSLGLINTPPSSQRASSKRPPPIHHLGCIPLLGVPLAAPLLLAYFICWFFAQRLQAPCLLYSSLYPLLPTQAWGNHSVFKKCFLNNQCLFQTSRVRRLLPRIPTTRNRITQGGRWEPDVSCLPHGRLRTWVQ